MSDKISDLPLVWTRDEAVLYEIKIPETWQCTAEVRWLGPPRPAGDPGTLVLIKAGDPLPPYIPPTLPRLQQRWVHYTGGVADREEWRDVPTVGG